MKFKNEYEPNKKKYWQGRVDDVNDIESLRWHQTIISLNLNKINELSINTDNFNFCFIGFKCNEGVKRNLGRIGAAKAPEYLRKEMSNFPFDDSLNISLYDAGNIACVNDDLEKSQIELSKAVELILSKNIFPIVLGGGHDIAFANYLGISNYLKNKKQNKIGIINFDAHFDLRPYKENGINSGTMFRQISENCKLKNKEFSYYCVGIQTYANTKRLFHVAKELNVKYELAKDVNQENITKIKINLDSFIKEKDYIYLTICVDVFSSSYAPGVSSPQPFGLLPEVTLQLIKHIAESKKMISFDIAEISPRFDEDNRTAKLGAIIIYSVINALSGNII